MEKKTTKKFSGVALANKQAAIAKARRAKELKRLEVAKPLTLWEKIKRAIGL